MVQGECHECGNEYKDLRQHWAMSDCEEDPSQSAKVEIKCAHCGKEHIEWRYRVEKNGGSFCSHECRDKGQRNGKVRECDWCGEPTYVHNCHLDNEHHFCDRDCSSNWRSEEFSGDGHPQWGGGKVTSKCEECGQSYKITPALQEETRFCSWTCKREDWATDPETQECANCGTKITRQPRNFRGENALCSHECYRQWWSEQQQGSGNPAWKGGKSGITAVRRMLGERSWNHYARQTRKEAGHVCEMCGEFQPHRKLAAHHIIPVASGGVNEQWCLMALCEVCHKKAENLIDEYTEPHLLKYVSE